MKKSYYTYVCMILCMVLGLLSFVSFVQPAEADDDDDDVATDRVNTDLQAWAIKIDNPQRFVVLEKFNGEAILDKETQLVWQREPKDQPNSSFFQVNFFGAVSHCYTVTTGNRMGWRLPTAEELTSLLVETPTQSGVLRAALPSEHPFIGITSDRYWSITSGSLNATPPTPGRYVVAMNEPEISTVALETNLQVSHPTWCVRGHGGGQSTREP